MTGLQAGLTHHHSLGSAHNDINPKNLALDKNDKPVPPDLGSCRRFGEQLVSAFTPGWIAEDEENTTSTKRYDEVGLKKMDTEFKTVAA